MTRKLYTSMGYSTKKMNPIQSEKLPFEYLWDYSPTIIDIDASVTRDTKEKTKKAIAPFKQRLAYFLAGELKGGIRKNENLVKKDMVVIDYDDLDIMYTVFLETIKEKLSGVRFILYPTISNYVPTLGMRFRLVIETDRMYTREENDCLIQNVIDHIGLPADSASKTWSQLMGMPTLNKLSRPTLITKQEGDPLKVADFLHEITKKPENVPQTAYEGDLTNETAIAMVQAYANRVGDKLLDRSYYLNPYMNIKFAYESGEIDLQTVEECLRILALGNEDWAVDNFDHFKRDTTPVQNGTPFAQFFGWAVAPSSKKDKGSSFDWIKQYKKELLKIYYTSEKTTKHDYLGCLEIIRACSPKNHNQLFALLEIEGLLYRQYTKEVMGEGEKATVKHKKMKPRVIANILKAHCKFYRLIVQSIPDNYPFIIYDLETGLYKQSFVFLKKLILKIDYEKLEHECKQVRHFLATECQEISKTKDANLIVCKNGLFNRTTRELEPFTPDKVFITGINTNYVENAPEPVYEDGWSIGSWIKELSGGDRAKELNFWRCIFHACAPNIEHKKSVFYYSEEGQTGKGTFKDLIVNIVGEHNHASANLKRFDTKWVNAELYGKTFVSGDENDDVRFIDGENFKMAVTNEYSSIEQKGERTFTDRLDVFIIQLMNDKPKFNKFNSAEKRRLLLVEFKNGSYSGKRNNPNVKNKYVKDQKLHEYILHKVLNMDDVTFEDTEESDELILEIELKRKPVKRFWDEYGDKFVSTRLPIRFLYNHGFLSYMKAEGVKDMYVPSLNNFVEELQKETGDEWTYTSQKKPANYFKHADFKVFEDIEPFGFSWTEEDKRRNQRLIERK